jgi:hypothetical protein
MATSRWKRPSGVIKAARKKRGWCSAAPRRQSKYDLFSRSRFSMVFRPRPDARIHVALSDPNGLRVLRREEARDAAGDSR